MLWLKCSLFSSLSSLSHYHLFFHCHTVAAFISLLLLSFPTCVPSSVFCIFPEPLLTGLVPSILTFNLSLASFLSSVFSPFLPSLFFTYSSMMRLFTFSLFDWQMIHIQPRVLVWIITHFLLCLSTFLCFLLFSPHITCLTNNSSNLLFVCVCVENDISGQTSPNKNRFKHEYKRPTATVGPAETSCCCRDYKTSTWIYL